MATRFLIKDKKGYAFKVLGLTTNHLTVDLEGSPKEINEQIAGILRSIDAEEDAFLGTCVANCLSAVSNGEYPYSHSVSTISVNWKTI